MSIADNPVQVDELAKRLKTPKFVRWVNPFFKALRETPPQVAITRRVPNGTRVYCVGDIHGRDDLLEKMAERVKADMEGRSFDQVVTVFLGDYVDRSFGSMRVLERLSGSEWPTPVIALAGNHEELLVTFLKDENVLEIWRHLGGLETLYSYGVEVGPSIVKREFKKIQTEFAKRLPDHHRHFLETLKTSVAIGDYFFCHAGVRPGVPLNRQHRDDLLNIRDPFLFSEVEHGKLVVHGHTPSVAPEIRPNRIGIDTAAYATNRLTCLVLEADERRFLYLGESSAQGDKQ
jgi:serine/threonine protein phosphatase 1